MAQFDRRYFTYFDWFSFFLTMLIALIGLTFVYSATYTPYRPFSLYFKKQAVGIAIGVVIYFIFCGINYARLLQIGYFSYFLVISLLAFTIIKGSIGMGAQRWINLGFFKFQPSELSKLFFPPFFVYYLYTEPNAPNFTTKTFQPLFVLLSLSSLLILKQPDLGTAILVFSSGIVLMWLAGLKKKIFIWMTLIFCISAPISWKLLKPYQKNRILVFLGEGSSQKERYHIEQSKIAIGSGGIAGKGFLLGTQNKFSFLPESRTDFIFSVLAEEIGFIGALLLLFLFALLFIRTGYLITTINNFYAQLLACGLMLPVIISTIINIGMVTNLLPVVGIPLPLMSYGITHVWITMASLGWCNGIIMRRFYFGEKI